MKTSILTLFLSIVVLVSGCGNSDKTQSETPSVAVEEKTLAILVDGSGTYSRKSSTQSEQAQAFFDQGLRFAWGFYFPESIASYQQAALHDPEHPMPYWGMAHAMGPNPNSRYGQMPDDPKGEGLKAIKKAIELIEKAEPLEAELINALYILYDQDSIPDASERDSAYLAAMRKINKKHPNDPDVALFIGLELLEQNDDAGLAQLNTARDRPRLLVEAANAGYNYLSEQGREQEAIEWWNESVKLYEIYSEGRTDWEGQTLIAK